MVLKYNVVMLALILLATQAHTRLDVGPGQTLSVTQASKSVQTEEVGAHLAANALSRRHLLQPAVDVAVDVEPVVVDVEVDDESDSAEVKVEVLAAEGEPTVEVVASGEADPKVFIDVPYFTGTFG
jgi:hypothetical protein